MKIFYMKDTTRKTIVRLLWIVAVGPFVLLFAALLFVWAFAKIPSFKELEHPDSKQATQVIAEGGEVLTTFHIENRTYVDYADISPNVVNAALATEDIRFHKHSGIDFKGLARVAVKTLAMGESSQGGGSTITQQLAKTLYPRRETNLGKLGDKIVLVGTKLKEWITAVKLERNYTKDEIMGMYLNSVFFGSSAFGIQTAAETFFNKKPSDLTVEEAATLIGMVNKPTRYNPVINPEHSLERRNFVIGQMCKAGYLTKAQRDSIQNIPITLNFHVLDHNSGLAPYFRDMIKRDMNAEKPKRSKYQYPEDYAADSLRWIQDDLYGWLNKNKKANGEKYNLDKDGLRIYTTINYKMQKFAEEAVVEHLASELQKSFWQDLKYKTNAPFSNSVNQETRDRVMSQARKWSDRYRMMHKSGYSDEEIYKSFSVPVRMRVFAWKYDSKNGVWKGTDKDTTMTPDDSIKYCKSYLHAAMMAIEPNTGHVKAYVGGPNYRYFKYDHISQGKRQIGSTVKPYLYSLALTQGMHPCDRVANVPQTFHMEGGNTWTPKGGSGGNLTLKQALTSSNNNVSAFLIKQFGPEAAAEMMHRMGVTGHIEEVYSLCVGSTDASIKDMVSAYNTFPSNGVYISPMFVTRIEDVNGNVISEFTNKKREVLGQTETYRMIDMMESVVNHGTGARLRYRFNLKLEIGGKTGTTNDNSDGWFIGYTPTITAGVWVGAEDRQVHFQSTALGQGANMALPIWGRFIKKCINDGTVGILDSDKFVIPQGVDVDSGCAHGGDYLGGAADEDWSNMTEEEWEEYESSQLNESAGEDYYFN